MDEFKMENQFNNISSADTIHKKLSDNNSFLTKDDDYNVRIEV